MRRLIFALLLALPLCAADGDITAVRVIGNTCAATFSCDGFVAEIDIEGLSTGGTYTLGLGTQNNPSSAKILFTATSPSFSPTDGSATTIQRPVWGTLRLRKPFPDNATADETAGAGFVTVRVVLSEYIYSGDTATVVIGSGVYTQGGTPNASYSGAVTNNSTAVYQKPPANWLNPNQLIVDGAFTLYVVGGSGDAFSGRSLAAVKFTVSDGTTTQSQVIAEPSKVTSLSFPDGITVPLANPVSAWVATFNASGFTQGATLTANFIGYPWVGTNVIDTSDGVHTQPTPNYAPLAYLNDKNHVYGRGAARVAPAGSCDNGTALVVSLYTYNPASPPAAYCDQYLAINAIRTYHNGLGAPATARANSGGGVVYHDAGNYTFLNGAITGGSGTFVGRLMFRPSSGVTRDQVVWDHKTAGTAASGVWVDNITLTSDGTGNVFTTMVYFAASNMVWSPTNTNSLYANTISSLYGNTITRINALPSATTGNYSVSPIAGNAFSVNGVFGYPHVFVGNTSSVSTELRISPLGLTIPLAKGPIIASNYLVSAQIKVADTTGDVAAAGFFGVLIENNALETIQNAVPYIKVAGSTSTADNVYNVILRGNTIVGYLTEWGYNASTQPLRVRKYFKMQGNLQSRVTTMTDVTTEGGPADGARTGSWSATWGVGAYGNYNIDAGAAYCPEFLGIYSTYGNVAAGFVADASFQGTKAGNGDYHLVASSPARNMIPTGKRGVLYDLDGIARRNDGTGAAGAYEYRLGSVRHRVIQSLLRDWTGGGALTLNGTSVLFSRAKADGPIQWEATTDGKTIERGEIQ